MSFAQSSATVTPRGSGESRRTQSFTGENYQGGNVSYRIASREVFTLPALTFNNNKTTQFFERPFAGTRWISGAGTITTLGVILDANGNEVFPFYPLSSAKGANASSTDEDPNPNVNDGVVVNYFSSVTRDSIPAGDYTFIVFAMDLSDPGLDGTGAIVMAGLEGGGVSTTPVTTIRNNPTPTPLEPEGEQHTLTYSEGAEGWPSFYSYSPDYMIGMNNYFYSYSGGNLYRHNTNELRNNFYGVQYNSTVTSVFNEAPFSNKLFKTISLESDEAWSTTLATDMDQSGFISNNWYEKKEGAFYAAVKNTNQVPASLDSFVLRSVNGIGSCTQFSGAASARQFDFSVSIDSIISIGDFLYYNTPDNVPVLGGKITAMTSSSITVDATINGATAPQEATPFIISFKNTLAESNGILGHYCTFMIESNGPSPTELFAVESEVMKSYP